MSRFILIILISVLIISCSNEIKQKDMENKEITWNVQYAGYDYDKYDEKGNINYESFVSEFDKFPWIEQVEKSDKIKQGCSATISVNNEKIKKSFWVSIMGNKSDNTFLVGFVYPKIKKGFLGIGKEKEIRWLDIYIAENSDKVKECFKYFFKNDFKKLEELLSNMEKFDEMEAQN